MGVFVKVLNIENEGMSCGSCVKKISDHFEGMDGLSETRICLEEQTVTVIGDFELSNIKVRNDLIELGFGVMSIKKA